jgi:hypothetical protein
MQVATSSLGAHARIGVKPLESTATTEQPLLSKVSVTSSIPFGAQMWRGLAGKGKTKKGNIKKWIQTKQNDNAYKGVEFWKLKNIISSFQTFEKIEG